MHQGREVIGLGQYFVVLKTFIVTRKAAHCIKDERLHVEDSILLFKKNSLWQGKQDIALGMRGYRFRKVFYCKKFTLARQAE